MLVQWLPAAEHVGGSRHVDVILRPPGRADFILPPQRPHS